MNRLAGPTVMSFFIIAAVLVWLAFQALQAHLELGGWGGSVCCRGSG